MQPQYRLANLCDRKQPRQTDRQTERQKDRQTARQTDRKVKTEGPKILLNDIFYHMTVIIGGSIRITKAHFSLMYKSKCMSS